MSSEERSTIYPSITAMVEPCPACRLPVEGGQEVARARPSQPWWHAACYDLACSTNQRRAGMTDAEFEADVAESLSPAEFEPEPPDDDFEAPQHESLDLGPCPECGEVGACGYDALGRPLIHPTRADDD